VVPCALDVWSFQLLFDFPLSVPVPLVVVVVIRVCAAWNHSDTD